MGENAVFIGKGEESEYLNLKYANRHGLITGATGAGKTVSLQILTVFRVSLVIAFSTRCAPSRRVSKESCARRRKLSAPTRRFQRLT